MAFEIPLDQIKQLQILLRKEAKLSWHGLENKDFTLPKLPSVAEAIAALDPSPPYLRCKNCKGRLLRGLQSSICVFCGTNPQKDLPPDPIKFKDTVGYRCLLDSLHLDGSEMVGPIDEGNESNRGRSASKDEIPLSELLDLEIRRPPESDGLPTSNSDEAAFQSKSLLNLPAVDLDSFFAQRESASDAFEEQLASNKQKDGAADNTFQANENLSLFRSVQVSETAAGSTEDQSGDSFSGWEADFQSASSGAVHKESKSFDHSAVDLDVVFASGKVPVGVKRSDDLNPSESMENDWFQGDIVRTSNAEVTGQTGKSEIVMDINYAKTAESANSSSTINFDWMQDNEGPGIGYKTTDIVTTDEVSDSFDAWDDFTGASTQNPSSSVSNSKITNQTGKSEMAAAFNDTKKAEGSNSSSTNSFDWMQDDQCLRSNNKTTETVATDEVADSFDTWNGFTSSTTKQDPSSNLGKQTVNQTSPSAEQTSALNILSSSSNSQHMNFGGLKQHDLFSGQSSSSTSSAGANIQQSGASSGRVVDVEATGGNSGDVSSAKLGSNVDDVEMLLSQMHDLSFMLESRLSVPPK